MGKAYKKRIMIKTDNNSTIFKNVSGVIIVVFLTKFFSFAKELIYSSYFGTSYLSDAYYTSNIVPNLINTPYFTGLLMFFVPTYIRVAKEKGTVEADKYASNTLTVYATISLLLSCFLVLTAPVIIQLLTGTKDDIFFENVATNLMQLSCLSFPITMITWIYTYLCHAHNSFNIPQILSLLNVCVSILGLFFLIPVIGIYAVPISAIFAWFIQMVLEYFYTKKIFKFQRIFDIKAVYIRQTLYLAIPIFISVGAEQLNHAVDNLIALRFSSGTISVLNYSQKLFNLFNSILPISIITVMYPILSKTYNEQEKFKAVIVRTSKMLLELIIPITFICVFFGTELVKVVFMRGNFTYDDVLSTSAVLRLYVIALPFWGLRELYNRSFFVQSNSKSPMLTTLIAFAINIILSILLSQKWGVKGIAAATAISCITAFIVNHFFLKRNLGKLDYKELKTVLFQVFASAVMMTIVINAVLRLISINFYINFIISLLLGGITYFVILLLLHNKDITYIYNKLKTLINNL